MSSDSSSQSNECTPKNEQGCACPLSKIPPEVWNRFLKPPFRKRHPYIFWELIIVIILILGLFAKNISTKDTSSPVGECIALISIQGPIIDAKDTLTWIRQIEKQSLVRGVLVRVNSPGGGAAASQEIYAAIKRIGKRIPVIVSMGATAASGGLMISMAGEKIYANPSTITGSIGVRMDIPQLQGLMEKIGVGQETLVTAPYKDAASYTHPLTPADRAYLESVLKNMHNQFVSIVAEGRKLSLEKAEALANGKIFTGQEALSLGLIDELGGQEEAVEWLANKVGIPSNSKLYTKPADRLKMMDIILGSMKILNLIGEGHSLGEILNICGQPTFMY